MHDVTTGRSKTWEHVHTHTKTTFVPLTKQIGLTRNQSLILQTAECKRKKKQLF